MIQFVFQNQVISADGLAPQLSVLDYLRLHLGHTGTKEGCAAGDCGACTVAVGCTNAGADMRYQSVNACITPLAALHGKHLVTVECLQADSLHPVQQAMVDCHGAQCGFCTPGVVMSLYVWWRQVKLGQLTPTRHSLDIALSGNLCRCTGYQPILRAAMQSLDAPAENSDLQVESLLATIESAGKLSQGNKHFYAPINTTELLTLMHAHPKATLMAGATDLGLSFTQDLSEPEVLIATADVAEMQMLTEETIEGQTYLSIGAAVTYAHMYPAVKTHYPAFADLLERLGSLQIRNRGTLAGNIATASPIGDTPPVLLALNAQLDLISATGTRRVACKDFFLSYRQTDLKNDEAILRVLLPTLNDNEQLKIAKISKRFDDDISTVCMAMWLKTDPNSSTMTDVRLAYGGMADRPLRAYAVEDILRNQTFDESSLAKAQATLSSVFSPLDDVRASAAFRQAMAAACLKRAYDELHGDEHNPVLPQAKDDTLNSPTSPLQLWQPSSNKEPTGGAGAIRAHDSATKHVNGKAQYVDDLAENKNTLHAAVGYSTIACGKILTLDVSEVKMQPGVVAVITLADVPGHTDIGPVFPGDPLLAGEDVLYHSQPLFAVAADTYDNAWRATKYAKVTYEEQPPLLDPVLTVQQKKFVRPSHQLKRGDVDTAIQQAPRMLEATMHIGGQEHYYLEGQVSVATPTENGGMFIRTSSQHPSEVQKLVAEVLAVPMNEITVEMRRMGGGFGGKETQAAQWACLAAVLAHKTKSEVKIRLPRAEDMRSTGKRHPFVNQYRIGIDDDGNILGADITVIGDCGCSPDLSDAIVDRAMFHADNAYYLPAAHIIGHRAFTNKVSNTAFRGFGGPQGMMIIERAMDDIARAVGKDPLSIRKQNLYGSAGRDTTPYFQTVNSATLHTVINELETSSDYWARRQSITSFNQTNAVFKKGLALTPVKFGISFTVQHLNQAGALLHIYTDGSVHINHGGTEMGQGLHTKVAQVVAKVFQIDLDAIHISATRTDKVPNTSPTAASSGADLNGQAAKAAALTIKNRLIAYMVEHESAVSDTIKFNQNQVTFTTLDGGAKTLSFAELAHKAYIARVSLSSTGYYRTPLIHYNRAEGKGRPFFYYATGAAVSEVIVDTRTGEYKVSRVDVLHDCGDSLNPAIDLGQVEGGFIQGMGWLTTEELSWDEKGHLRTFGASTYKIPTCADTPAIFNVAMLQNRPCEEDSIYHSKAVGEPPFMLAISVWSALRDAVSSVSNYQLSPDLDTPATPERMYWAIQQIQTKHSGAHTHAPTI